MQYNILFLSLLAVFWRKKMQKQRQKAKQKDASPVQGEVAFSQENDGRVDELKIKISEEKKTEAKSPCFLTLIQARLYRKTSLPRIL